MDVGQGRQFHLIMLFVLPLALAACKKDDSVAEAPSGFQEISSKCESTAVPNRFLVNWKDGTLSIEHARNREEFLRTIMEPNEGQIDFAEHDQLVHLEITDEITGAAPTTRALTIPDDWGQQIVEASVAWSRGIVGQGVTVAVVDSGVDINHVQIQPRLATNSAEIVNGVDDDGNGYIDDVYGYDFQDGSPQVNDGTGHGTHVAGVIVADHAVSLGETTPAVKGLAPGAQLLPLDFMTDSGAGSIGNAIRAIKYAVSRGAKVINASWGGGACSATLRQTIQELEAQGVLMVVAAGNSGSNLDWEPEYPAAFQSGSQITVGASTFRDIMAGFSNYSYSLVHLAAPGADIYSTLPGNHTGDLSGTSMATPFVSATAALLWSFRPQATVAQIRHALLNGVDRDPADPRGVLAVSTGGRLNIRKALDELARQLP
ncbi:MAG: S8 family serine peptidase [Bdellovibrionaceae bacterium]|nr:S8 family serine peptidase [Pseudobdellovibrionaceae bacterium]